MKMKLIKSTRFTLAPSLSFSANAVKKNAAVIQGATASVERSNVSEADKSEAVELLTERNNLKREIDAIGDKTLAGPQELRLNTVNELLGKLVRKGAGEKAPDRSKLHEFEGIPTRSK